ncbi:MFS transporter [Streptomyces tubbatahanensis]|uniref:MFS transporter n=1 Tax=Streptomyces tubbatahanensis TaxID=2923272 RepID=A0ABY3XVR1_9ACTN|nr:MFS transporter [Streptomyces tubbatahanensis]UNS98576.1 MFS transporter [Streptomyces tubbatahanensis]
MPSAEARNRRPHPLRHRDFRLLFTGRALSLLGDAVVPTALSLAVLRATGSTAALALVLGCAMLPKLLLLPVGGVLADRFRARTLALTTDLVRCASQLLVGLQLLGQDPSLAVLATAEAVGGAASAFAMPCLYPLVTGTVEATDRQRANALVATAESAGRLGGPALAGLLVLTVGPGWAFLLDAATFALSACLLALLRVTHVPLAARSFLADLVEGWTQVSSRAWYWPSLLAHAVHNVALSMLLVLGPAVAVGQLGGEGVWVAVVQAGGVGLLVGNALSSRVYPRRPVLTVNLLGLLFCLPLALFAAAAPAPWTIASYGVAMAGLGYLNPTWQTTVQNAIPPTALARVTSYDWLLSLAAMPVGYTLGPWAASQWGTAVPLTAAAVLASAGAATAAVPAVRRFTSDGPRPAGGADGADVADVAPGPSSSPGPRPDPGPQAADGPPAGATPG